jgi:tripartite-type tricarboxylate transporter receptor subunit TctC
MLHLHPPRVKATQFPRRHFVHLAAGAAVLPILSRSARAQAYPTRPVHIVVGYPAGGGADIYARLIAQWLSERFGQSFLIENRPGASGNIATEAVSRAPADGYTLLLAASPNAINATLYDKLNFNFIRDTAPVARVAVTPLVMVVNSAFPAKTVPEFIAYAKANQGKLTLGSPGAGTPNHVAGELFKMITGVKLEQVQYRGGAPAIADLLGEQVQVMFDVIPECIEYVRAGKLRALAVMSAMRSPVLPEIPVIAGGVERNYHRCPMTCHRRTIPAHSSLLLRWFAVQSSFVVGRS